MNDTELDRLIAAANPYDEETVRRLPIDDAGSELLTEILTTTAPPPALAVAPGPGPRRRRRVVLLAAAAAVVAVAVGLVGALFPVSNPAAPPSAFAAEAIAVAESNQRLLIDDPAWTVTSIGEFTPEWGDLKFMKDGWRFDISWMPAKEYTGSLKEYYGPNYIGQPIDLLGRRGSIFQSRGFTEFTVVMPPVGNNYLSLRADLGSERAYRDVLAKVKQVDVNTWLSAMPADTVLPNQTKKTVDAMIADMQLPPGFDKTRLYQEHLIDRYELGVRVAGAVSCAWLDRWYAARKAGDAAQMKQAVIAMNGSRHWKILVEMNGSGDYPEEVWGWADSMAKNLYFTQDGYRSGLVCPR
ncbi:hypothetical protein [Kribbella sp. NPDC006257]|uniref:hypothetical protein n=1 Tax=Kribbella sp. NPDC006257 TaxID=3156738 RepID=UPI0033B82AB2